MEQQPTSYFGKINVLSIFNNGIKTQYSTPEFTDNHYKTVHYPDCQQMVVRLPETGFQYEDVLIFNTEDQSKVLHEKVQNLLSGSVQMILDTLFIPPGKYELFVNVDGHKSFGLVFEKWEEGYEPELIPIPEPASKQPDKPTVYRDGFGNILPNEDLELRKLAFEKLKDQFISKIKYFTFGRDGYLIFTEGEKSARFEMEMGGGDCMFFILLPDKNQWEKTTGFSLADREKIVEYIAHITCRDQAGGAKYKITENDIIYYRK